jgi:hypothetical protein
MYTALMKSYLAILCVLGASVVSADAATPLQKCHTQILKSTQQYLSYRTGQLDKCLAAKAAVDLAGYDSGKANDVCTKAALAVQKAFTKGVAKLSGACTGIEAQLFSASDPLGLLNYTDCGSVAPSNCPTSSELATAYVCLANAESDYVAALSSPRAFVGLGSLHSGFIPQSCSANP